MPLVSRLQQSQTEEPVAENVAFDVSPDGRQIVFSAGDGNLYLLGLMDRKVTRLTRGRNGASPVFSPDGARILYCASATGEDGFSLYELTLADLSQRRLTHEPKVSDSQPAYSRDGARITFTRAYRYRPYSMGGMVWSDYDICVMPADGSDAKRLTTKKYYSAVSPCFTSEGDNIVFAADLPYDVQDADRRSGGSLVTLLQVSSRVPGEPRILLPLPKPGRRGGAQGTEPAVSPDGRQIAFISDRSRPFQYDLWTMDRDGTHLRALNITRISAYNEQPVYLPDGKSLLFLAGTEEGSRGRPLFSIWQVDIDGSHARRVADEGLFLRPMDWKPGQPEPKDLSALQALLASGGSPGQRDGLGRSLLSNASHRGDVAMVRLLLQKGASPNTPDADGATVLQRAIEGEHLEVVRLLIARGAQVKATPRSGQWAGMPPLVLAALGGDPRMAELLIGAGADVRATDARMGNTALQYACGTGNVALARLLIRRGSPIDARNAMGGTALMEAAMAGRPELVKLLIARGANVRARDDRTRQMYGMAQFMGDTEGAEKIRRSGRLNTLREDGRSVLDWAQLGGNREVIALLKKAGATR